MLTVLFIDSKKFKKKTTFFFNGHKNGQVRLGSAYGCGWIRNKLAARIRTPDFHDYRSAGQAGS